MRKISVIIPAYNEESGIAAVIKDVKENMSKCSYEHEIIVVDDASQDRTQEMAQREGVRIITHTKNKGYGASIKTGIENSSGEFVAIIDGDGSYSGKDLLNLTAYAEENDMVVGERTKPGANDPILRKIAKLFLKSLASYLTETKIPDLNSGLRIMRKDRLMQFFGILPKRYSFTTTITIAFLNSDMKVKFVPIDYNKRRGKSKIRPIHDTLNFIQLILRTVIYFNPLKVFVPVSIFLFLIAIAVFLYSYFLTPQVMDITTIVLILTSLQILAIGMVADLIIKRIK